MSCGAIFIHVLEVLSTVLSVERAEPTPLPVGLAHWDNTPGSASKQAAWSKAMRFLDKAEGSSHGKVEA